MAYALKYIYDDGSEKRCISTIYYDGKHIRFQLHNDEENDLCPSLRGRDIRNHLLHLIMLPIVRNKLRAKTLPFGFEDQIEPHSMEHFLSIPHDCGSFRFSPIRECDTIPFQETIVA